jgi:hypothetical protein
MIRGSNAGPSFSQAGCTGNLSLPACSAYLYGFERVTDGARTPYLRSYNPLTCVSGCCRTLQNRLT